MSIIDDDETLGLFIEEAKDNLSELEKDLLIIEAAGDGADPELVNQVFRAVHSIKGGAGFFGLEKIKDLSHGMENLLNMMRNREILVTPAIINALLISADTLNAMILDPKTSNEVAIEEHLAALKDAIASASGKTQPEGSNSVVPAASAKIRPEGTISITPPGSSPAFVLNRDEVDRAFGQRDFLYLVHYHPTVDFTSQGKSFSDLLISLGQTGIVVASGASDEGKEPFFILFATVLDPEIIGQLVEVPAERIWRILPAGEGVSVEPLSENAEVIVPQAKVEEVSPSAPAFPPKKEKAEASAVVKQPMGESNLRVNVKVLDRLMTLAGELVLTRNQMVQNVSAGSKQAIENTAQRLNLVTSDLQEAIMSTRMQPIGNVFNKFNRVVRDLSRELGKEIDLIIEGEEVDLDKTIIEAISDPLTHLIRNAVDHGVEMPQDRRKAGKDSTGTIKLSAFHEAGQVIIAIADDGKGIDPVKVKEKARSMGLLDSHQLDGMSDKELVKLIFHPGFSLAPQVTDISGRGVGMDVVHTNLTRINGVIDIESQVGRGTSIRIKLPLTLAIIPSLLIGVGSERYAIPQVNLVELVRVPAAQVKKRIERIGSALVMRLRGSLLPIVHLRDVFGIPAGTFNHPETDETLPDRRREIADRRNEGPGSSPRSNADRRFRSQSAINIVVVTAGDFHYGIIVDTLLDSQEIVVKPLGRHLGQCKGYAGAAILGDGKVALILDVVGISNLMKLSTVSDEALEKANQKQESLQDAQSLVIVKNAPNEQFAIPLGLVSRIERIRKRDIEITAGQMDVKYRGSHLALFSIEDVARVSARDDLEYLYVIVFPVAGREVGILVSQVFDVVDIDLAIDETTFVQPGIIGSSIILGETTLLIDLYGIVSALKPEWTRQLPPPQAGENKKATILLVEDSLFFQNQIKGFIQDAGYPVITALDGLLALEALDKYGKEIGMVVTDIEMPNLDGLELTKRIRANAQFKEIPVIAVTSVAGEAAERKGLEAGIDDYLIKLDREKILERVEFYLRKAVEERE